MTYLMKMCAFRWPEVTNFTAVICLHYCVVYAVHWLGAYPGHRHLVDRYGHAHSTFARDRVRVWCRSDNLWRCIAGGLSSVKIWLQVAIYWTAGIGDYFAFSIINYKIRTSPKKRQTVRLLSTPLVRAGDVPERYRYVYALCIRDFKFV